MTSDSYPENKSFFASPQRSGVEEIANDYSEFVSNKSFIEILGAITGIVIVLNKNRQIIYGNENYLKALGLSSISEVLGKRPGEALGCIHAHDMDAGCGTSEACTVCGVVKSIVESQKSSKKVIKETRLTTKAGEFLVSWDMMVSTSPINLDGKSYYVLSLNDISHEKRRQSLERIFFHDILNTAGGLSGLIGLLKITDDPQDARQMIEMSDVTSKSLIEEILHHKQIRSAENGDLAVNFAQEKAVDMMKQAVEKIGHHQVAEGKTVGFVDNSGGVIIETDRVLLQRILVNMLKNALEAITAGKSVNAEVITASGRVIFTVQNESVIPRDVQMQIFQRSFSTKGKGRGLGTYSIKLLTEDYLKGKAGFRSNDKEGTVFFIELPVKILV